MTGTALDRPRCGAQNRKGLPCRQLAGARTPHPGIGRCYLHGGLSPVKHGRYSKLNRERIRLLIEQYGADPEPTNMLPELAAARALFQDFVERYDRWATGLFAWHASFSEEYRERVAAALEAHDPAQGPFLPPDPAEGFAGKPPQLLDVADGYRIVSEVTKIVERIERVRYMKSNAFNRDEVFQMLTQLGRVVALHVKDEATKEAIHRDWLLLADVLKR